MSFRGISKVGRKISFFLVSLSLLCFLAACGRPFKEGYYSGKISTHDVPGVENQSQVPVNVFVERSSPNGLWIRVEDLQKKALLEPIQICNIQYHSLTRAWSFSLKIPGIRPQSFDLSEMNTHAKRCFESKGEPRAEVCVGRQSLSLSLSENHSRILSLAAFAANGPREVKGEDAKVLTVQEAMNFALEQNLGMAFERELMIQAKLTARAAYLSLLPQLGWNSIGAIVGAGITGDPLQLLAGAGDLIPFVFPGRWLDAMSFRYQFEAQRMAWVLTRVNLASAVHTMTLSYIWQREYRNALQNLKSQFDTLEAGLPRLVQKQWISEPDSQLIQIQAAKVTQELDSMTLQVEQAAIQLAEIIGLQSPHGIESILFFDAAITHDVEEMPRYDSHEAMLSEQKSLTHLAIAQSPELHQQWFLKEAARKNESKLLVNWCDPSAEDPGLGFSLFPQWQKAKSIVAAINFKMEEIEQGLRSQSYLRVESRNQAVKQFLLQEKTLSLQMDLYKRVMKPLLRAARSAANEGIEGASSLRSNVRKKKIIKKKVLTTSVKNKDVPVLEPEELRETLEELLDGLGAFFRTRAWAQIEQATMDRLAFDGYYNQFVQEGNLP